MQTFQDRVLKRIADSLTYYGLEPSISFDWANTGLVYGHNPNAITPVVTIGFDFQPASYKLTITVGSRKIPSQLGRPDYFDFYYPEASAKTRFWNCLEAELKQLDETQTRKERETCPQKTKL